jgi:hypothetical protein
VLGTHCPPGEDVSFVIKFMDNHSDDPGASSLRAQARVFRTEWSMPRRLYKYQSGVCILDYFSGDEATYCKYRPDSGVPRRTKSLCVCEPYYGLSLHDFVVQRSRTNNPEAIRGLSCEEWYVLITGVFYCVYSLEREAVAHCDIKPKNIVYSPRFGPLLIDFGGAQEFREPATAGDVPVSVSQARIAHMCTPRYADPYVVRFGNGGLREPPRTMEKLFGKADAYSAARSIVDVLCGDSTLVTKLLTLVVTAAVKDRWRCLCNFGVQDVQPMLAILRVPQFARLDPRVRGLLKLTLNPDATERPSGSEVFRALTCFLLRREGLTINKAAVSEWLECERDRLRHLLLNMEAMTLSWTVCASTHTVCTLPTSGVCSKVPCSWCPFVVHGLARFQVQVVVLAGEHGKLRTQRCSAAKRGRKRVGHPSLARMVGFLSLFALLTNENAKKQLTGCMATAFKHAPIQ